MWMLLTRQLCLTICLHFGELIWKKACISECQPMRGTSEPRNMWLINLTTSRYLLTLVPFTKWASVLLCPASAFVLVGVSTFTTCCKTLSIASRGTDHCHSVTEKGQITLNGYKAHRMSFENSARSVHYRLQSWSSSLQHRSVKRRRLRGNGALGYALRMRDEGCTRICGSGE